MKYEYLIFNIIVISGPIFFGSLKNFYFLNHFKDAIFSVTISAIPFLIWDVVVTERHWFFAEEYTLGLRILGLPIEEIMFFFTVPYACLFTWQMVKKYLKSDQNLISQNSVIIIIVAFIFGGVYSLFIGKEYTALASLFFSVSILIDRIYGAKIFTTKLFWIYFGFVSFFTLVFNGYLTWRPIVTYDEIYQLDFRIFTIPIEDFFFGFALMILATTIFEKRIKNASH